ncbi:MAG: aromatic amino acid ammonia-lyase [Myxococcales bacterium]
MSERGELCLGEEPLRIEHVARAAQGTLHVHVSKRGEFRHRIEKGARIIEQRLERGVPTYGVNTGFGASVKNAVPGAQAWLLSRNLPRYHGCGVGPLYSEEQSRAIVLVRLASLCAGYSGVRHLVLERLEKLLQASVVPAIPSRGSVGASGDLTPLSYVAALLTGERDAWYEGQVIPASVALQKLGLAPIELGPKESLAIMNGTSVMGALTCLAFDRAQKLARTASALTAMALEAIGGQRAHFDARLFKAKAHPGQIRCASWIREILNEGEVPRSREGRIQERYSIRCAPHVIGALVDALEFSRGVLETEINGASDNPLVDPDTGDVLHGGNFYGGHVAMVADTLKVQVANLADLMERQLVLLNDPGHNGGLPENLIAVRGEEARSHHGFKAMEITASALTAEALKLSMPASVFSRSTENHNQDKVSMGSISAFDFERAVELVESVAAVHAIACAQGVELRGVPQVAPRVQALHAAVRSKVELTLEDRPMDRDIEAVTEMVRRGALWGGET